MVSHYHSATSIGRRAVSGQISRLGLLVLAIALLAAACSADGGSVEAVSNAVAESAPATTFSAPVTVTSDSVPATSAPTDVGEELARTFRMETELSFSGEAPSGTFEVTQGAEEFGCSTGTFEDLEVLAGVLRTHTCDSGGDGELVIFLNPNEDLNGPGDLNATWDTRVATGEFSGFDAAGSWAFEFAGAGGNGTFEMFRSPPMDTTDGTIEKQALNDAYLGELVESVTVPEGEGAFMAVVIDDNGNTAYASEGSDQAGTTPTPDDAFRVGSITKVFTSLATLQLVNGGVVDLDAPATDYISRVSLAPGVTVRDLLQHTSGIPNVNRRPGFFDIVLEDPARVWTPEEMIDLVADVDPVFEPGTRFGYSNTNYLLLGILIEEITGQPYDEVIRNGILDPLGLEDTYIAGFEDGPVPFGAFTGIMGPVVPTDFDYTSLATAAWSAGGMVSSARDLHSLFTALYDGRLISDALVTEMTENSLYGLGLELFEWSDGLVGHSGQIPGYITVVRHDPASGATAFTVSTGPQIEQRPALVPLYGALSAQSAS